MHCRWPRQYDTSHHNETWVKPLQRKITTAERMTSPAANEASHLRTAWRTVGPLEPHFRDQGAKKICYPWITVSKTVNIFRICGNIIEKSRPDLYPKINTFMRCRLEEASDVISGGNLGTFEGYVVLNFETASISRLPRKSQAAICVTLDDGTSTWATFSKSRSKKI